MPNKPIWTEGILLSQHHFQQQDRYHESLLRDRLQAVIHYDWGVTELELDDRGLASGQFKVRRFAAIWPDGTSLRCGDDLDEPPPAPRSFEEAFPPDAATLEVFLGLAQESQSALLAQDDEAGEARRFVRAVQSVPDVNSGGSPQEVEWARPNLRLFFGKERRDGFTTIRIAEIVKQRNGQAIIRDNYVPPVLQISASPFLLSGARRVLSGITARQRELASDRRLRQRGAVELHSTNARKFWLLHTLNGWIPQLTHLVETGRVHPEELYLALSGLAGQLCSFAENEEPTALPKFKYLELGEVFEELFAKVISLLSGGIEQPYIEIGLEHRPDGMFIAKFPDPTVAAKELFVAVQSTMPEALVRERVPAVLKVAGWNKIYDVVKQARHGVRNEIEWNPSAALPLKPGVCFFRLRREGPFWDDIARTSSIALYLPLDADWKGTSLALYAVDPSRLQ